MFSAPPTITTVILYLFIFPTMITYPTLWLRLVYSTDCYCWTGVGFGSRRLFYPRFTNSITFNLNIRQPYNIPRRIRQNITAPLYGAIVGFFIRSIFLITVNWLYLSYSGGIDCFYFRSVFIRIILLIIFSPLF